VIFSNGGLGLAGLKKALINLFNQVSDVCITTWVFQRANSTRVPFGLN